MGLENDDRKSMVDILANSGEGISDFYISIVQHPKAGPNDKYG